MMQTTAETLRWRSPPPGRSAAVPTDPPPGSELVRATASLLRRAPADFTARPLVERFREDPVAAARFADRSLAAMALLPTAHHQLARACALVSAAGRLHAAIEDGNSDRALSALLARWRAEIAAFASLVEQGKAD